VTGRDAVALVMAVCVSAVILVVTWSVVALGYKLTGEGVLGAIIGAVLLSVLRYLGARDA